MSSVLSMASVNKIKELAEAREYGVAVEILDTQDLTKSLNPQFLRICGEIYSENGRYDDARRILLRAHKMAPEANRIIFSIIELYLKLGYFSLADEYYHQYIFNAGGIDINSDTKNKENQSTDTAHEIPQGSDINTINYIMNKARGSSYKELYDMLFPYYRDNIDEVWTYELFLLCSLLEYKDTADAIAADYIATYKLEGFSGNIKEIQSGKKKPEEFFNIYSETVKEDDNPELEELRAEERAQLEKDYYRMNPKEPEIMIMVDDNDEDIPKSVIKKQMKKSKKKGNEVSEEGLEDVQDVQGESTDDKLKSGLKSIIKKAFKKKNKEEIDELTNEDEQAVGEEQPVPEENELIPEETDNTGESEVAEEAVNADETEIIDSNKSEEFEESEEQEEYNTDGDIGGLEETDNTNDIETEDSDGSKESGTDNADSVEGNEDMREDMQEIKLDLAVDDIVSYEFDDGFAAETDNIEELQGEFDDYYSNPFDKINAYKIIEDEKKKSELELSGKRAEDIAMKMEIDNAEETGFEIQQKEESDSDEVREETEAVAETESEVEEETEAEPEIEAEAEIEAEPEIETEAETETEPEIEAETETETEPEVEAEAETEAEPEIEAEAEIEAEPEVEAEAETEAEPEVETEAETQERTEFRSKIEFPEFSSPLFPDLNKEIGNVVNNFDDIMNKENDKLKEQLLKEEQMQREAEELLAKLGL